ncbi:MAG: hypothetical protein LBG22_03415 [Treponema sp.]|jgi:hypothetical protein|nr:hypothetical protein [Treponema sp.]
MPGQDGEWGVESEYHEKDGAAPAEKNGDGEETGQHKTPYYDAALNEDFLYQALLAE